MVQREEQKKYVLSALNRFWVRDAEPLNRLPIVAVHDAEEPLPPRMQAVLLPDWAVPVGVDGGLLVPSHLVASGDQPSWKRTDWFRAAFWYLNGSAERAFERINGPIHSYSVRLDGWDDRLWQRAWVNRIALFLRLWSARVMQRDAEELLGPLPEAKIVLTHDTDAVSKTWAIRGKQTAFNLFNSGRSLFKGEIVKSLQKLGQASRFFFSRADYWCFEQILALEDEYGVRSHFNFFGGYPYRRPGLTSWLMDPVYDVCKQPLVGMIKRLQQGGWSVGLHQSYTAWKDSPLMQREKQYLESALQASVSSCRQHWLRFSWEDTWSAQENAGFHLDTTLGFNDRPGFRNGTAFPFNPFDAEIKSVMALSALPMVLMDSHLYDYGGMSSEQREGCISYWVDELHDTHGEASIIWHQRVMSSDYGWGDGYRMLLESLRDK